MVQSKHRTTPKRAPRMAYVSQMCCTHLKSWHLRGWGRDCEHEAWLTSYTVENKRNKIMGYLQIVSKSRNKMWLGHTLSHGQGVRGHTASRLTGHSTRLLEPWHTYTSGFLNVLTNSKGSLGTAISPSMKILQNPQRPLSGKNKERG